MKLINAKDLTGRVIINLLELKEIDSINEIVKFSYKRREREREKSTTRSVTIWMHVVETADELREATAKLMNVLPIGRLERVMWDGDVILKGEHLKIWFMIYDKDREKLLSEIFGCEIIKQTTTESYESTKYECKNKVKESE